MGDSAQWMDEPVALSADAQAEARPAKHMIVPIGQMRKVRGSPNSSAWEVKGISLTMQQSYQEIGSEERDPRDDRADSESPPLLHCYRS